MTAFPKTKEGGNKAGVVYPADGLKRSDMLRIAKEIGYSETAFVFKSLLADFKVRFFTPVSEVDLCGHATIATFNILRDEGIIKPGMYTQQTGAGLLKLDVKEDIVYMQQRRPLFGEQVNRKIIEKCFGAKRFTDDHYPIQIISTGMREVFVPIKDTETLNQLVPNFKKIAAVSTSYSVIGFHLFALDDEVDAYGRNFAPLVGIDEESATGTSNGALACYLNRFVKEDQTEFVLRQGYSMNMPSEISAKITKDQDRITDVWVGGSAVKIKEETKN
jgi:PhzF family phenazine biosynthesis protein